MNVKEFRDKLTEMLRCVDADTPIVFIHRKGKAPFMGLDPVAFETVNAVDNSTGAVVSHVVVSLVREGKRDKN